MNMNYNILHVDDSKEFIDGNGDVLNGLMEKVYLVPHIDSYYNYDTFIKEFIEKSDEFDFVKYDLVLVDYMLSDDEVSGMDVIRKIRQKNIYTDIIFYSSNYDGMRENIKKELYDDEFVGGVYYCDRDELNDKVMDIVSKSMKKAANISNIRGLIIDATSNFDVISKDVCKIMYDSLDECSQKEVINILCERIEEAKQQASRNFEDINLITDDKKKLIKVLNSAFYVISNADKYKIFEYIINRAIKDRNFSSDEYNKCNVISHRNKIAHQYIAICKKYKKLLVAKSVELNKELCNGDCEKCKVEYSYKDLEKIRESLFKYYGYFERLKKELL